MKKKTGFFHLFLMILALFLMVECFILPMMKESDIHQSLTIALIVANYYMLFLGAQMIIQYIMRYENIVEKLVFRVPKKQRKNFYLAGKMILSSSLVLLAIVIHLMSWTTTIFKIFTIVFLFLDIMLFISGVIYLMSYLNSKNQ